MCWGLIASLFVATGCNTVNRANSNSLFGSAGDNAKQADENLATRNPFRRSSSKSGDDGKTSRRDAATEELIVDELADATPEERDRLLSDFESLDPLLIVEILKLRRMRIEMEQEKQQLADVRRTPANERYQGLGADYPGNRNGFDGRGRASDEWSAGGRERFADSQRPEPGGVRPVADSRDEFAPRSRGQEFGHSQSYADNSRIPIIDPRSHGSQRDPQSPGVGRSAEVMREPAMREQSMQRPYADETRRRPDDGNTDFLRSQRERPVISANRQMTAPLDQQNFRDEAATRQQYPNPREARSNASGNPLQFAGIDTSTVRRQDGNGMLPAYQQSDAMTAQWLDSLQRTIVSAEEQAYAAQAAWEQADQLSVGNNLDENSRRELIASRRQDFVEKQVHLRMLYLMSGQQARALERVRGLEPADQEFWTQVMWSLANYFDVEGIPNQDDRATQTITQLRSAIQRLQETAKLEIRNVDFCTKISSFGNYEAFESNVFNPGQPVMVYGEIQNFTSDRGSDGVYRTQLQSTIEVHKVTTQNSEVIETIKFDATTDLCRNHRRDYYHSYELQIPAKATSGSYALVLIVEDQFSKRVATFSRNFTVK